MHKLTEQGKKALRKAAKYLAKNPQHFDMQSVFDSKKNRLPLPGAFRSCFVSGCGTTMCIAGCIGFQNFPNLSIHADQVELVAHVMQFLSGGYDEDLDYLFMVFEINSTNVVEVVEVFIEKGILGVQELLDCDLDDSFFNNPNCFAEQSFTKILRRFESSAKSTH